MTDNAIIGEIVRGFGVMVAIVLLIPIVAIVGGITNSIVKNILRHSERKMEITAQWKVHGGAGALRAEIAALRDELARLRDTSTQYDISIQHMLEELHQRVAFLESRQEGYKPRLSVVDDEQAATIQHHKA